MTIRPHRPLSDWITLALLIALVAIACVLAGCSTPPPARSDPVYPPPVTDSLTPGRPIAWY